MADDHQGSDPESDPGLLEIRSRTDDFDEFFRQHYAPVVASLSAAFGDRELAAEAVQDAFTKAYARWRRVRAMDLPVAWVRRVAINRLRDLHRSSERRRRTEDRAVVAMGSGRSLDDAASVIAEDEIVALLRPLPVRQRTVLALYYVEDLPVAEIATSMRITQGSVKAHLSQGRAAVARALGTDEDEDEVRRRG